MIYAVTALIAGIPNILMVTREDDRFLVVLGTSLLVVSRYVGYVKLAGFGLLDPARIKQNSGKISLEIGAIIIVLLGNAAYFLNRFGLEDISIAAISASCLGSAGVLISHQVSSKEEGITRSALMRMVSGVLIAIGVADICITKVFVIPQLVGLTTLFFGIYTERKSLSLALRQTIAIAGAAVGIGMTLRVYFDPPAILQSMSIHPALVIGIALTMAILGMVYYLFSRRAYTTEPSTEH